MQILIERDGGATRIRKEVADEAEARQYEDRGFVVYLVAGEGDDEILTRLGQAQPEEAPKKAAKKKAA